ncbi:MAG: TIGR02996 domain-containing protein [Planctomycetes bacterium]|nr:TIGR02996 domain-containing protein [Planctomycetota bacterium]
MRESFTRDGDTATIHLREHATRASVPMNERDAFVRGIAADLYDDTPRLAFADWLDEHGEHDRAEFVRVQCELEPMRDRYEIPRAAELHNERSTSALTTCASPSAPRNGCYRHPRVGPTGGGKGRSNSDAGSRTSSASPHAGSLPTVRPFARASRQFAGSSFTA